MLEYAVAAAICIPAFFLAFYRSTWLIDYSIAVQVFNRGIRRYVDWQSGGFDPFSMVALTPLVVSGLAALVVLNDLNSGRRLGKNSKRAMMALISAVGIAFAVGVVRNGAATVVELGLYLGPIGMMGFGLRYGSSGSLALRWARSTVIIGIVAAAYGMYQFYTIPPWDAAWVRAVGFEGYLGALQPTKMTLFSTLAERGPAGVYFAGITILLLLRPGLVGQLRWPAAVLTAYAMLLTYSRSGFIWVGLAVAAMPVVQRGRNFGRLLGIVLVGALAGQLLLSLAPTSDKISGRFNSLGNLQNDGSFRARIFLATKAIGVVATNPLGLGLGAQTAAARRAGGGGAVTDSTGYLTILQGFGVIGGGLLFGVLRMSWLSSAYVNRRVPDDRQASLFRAWLLSGLVALLSGNWLPQALYFWLLAGGVIGHHDALVRQAAMGPVYGAPPQPMPRGPAT